MHISAEAYPMGKTKASFRCITTFFYPETTVCPTMQNIKIS